MVFPPPLPPAFDFPLAVSHRDHSGLFAIDATVTAWRTDPSSRDIPAIRLTIGSGTLHDSDKGTFQLDGLELAMRVTDGRLEPLAVLSPSVLSEFQQEGVLDAISSYLNGLSPAADVGERP